MFPIAASNLANADIESLTLLAVMNASKGAATELQAIAGEMKQANEAKVENRKPEDSLSDGEIHVTAEKAKPLISGAFPSPLDELSGASEQFQLGLQRLMDAIAKTAATMSLVQKKQSDTQDEMVRTIR